MSSHTVDASPTKRFFVDMLTRDIELIDAILDLLDNCIDGIIRSQKARRPTGTRPYEGFSAAITASPELFKIEDNCGGIPRALAEKVAFRLGRPSEDELKKLDIELGKDGTVGLYGIGMKRAIFKMGQRATVSSHTPDGSFQIQIDPSWLATENWTLPLVELDGSARQKGTIIEVKELRKEVGPQFSSDHGFLDRLRDAIAQQFSVSIEKGFQIVLNEDAVRPVTISLLVPKKIDSLPSICPYVFKGTIKGVAVEVMAGFHRDLSKVAANPAGADEESEAETPSVRSAGWSIVCNDRLVLFGDKSEMTGWGVKPVPNFHPQYNSIAGVVVMRSDDPSLLPFNTKKSGIDGPFGAYLRVLDIMKDGVRRFITYTNKWKAKLDETVPHFKSARPHPAHAIAGLIPQELFQPLPKSRLSDPESSGFEFKHDLPLPLAESRTTRRVCFARPIEEIRELNSSQSNAERYAAML